ncbi:hypothetical protein QOZ80_9AG0681010 [Eleusine coracana subsp. coracana]|nr:hypothetical protein QOZ80_9AG0681010 [Eleusine coracana subsp. coracana]
MGILGEGGFGTVSKAKDTLTGELVAIKSAKHEDEGGTAMLREAALLASCRGNPAVVGLRETRRAMRRLLAGVDAMGKQGVVHGDLKPENVLIRNKDDGSVILLICDFGLSVSVVAPPCPVEGTLHYLAPEQMLAENCAAHLQAANRGKSSDGAVDPYSNLTWSLG